MSSEWFYDVGGLELGPVTFDELLELARTEQIAADDRVKLGGRGQWRRVGSIGRLMAALPFQTVIVRSVSSRGNAQTRARPAGLAPAATLPISRDSKRVAAVRQTAGGVAVNGAARLSAEGERRPTIADDSAPVRSNPLRPVAAASPATRVPAAAAQAAAEEPPRDPDAETARRVREALDARNIPGFARLELQVRDGVAVVRGRLASTGERLLVIRVVERVSGIDRVVDSLEVSNPGRVGSAPVIATRAASLPVWKPAQGITALAAFGLLGAGYWAFASSPARPVSVHPVRGRVVMDGQPLANASVVLHRLGDSRVPANLHPRARVMEDGTFKLETFDPADGAPNGEFVATVFLNKVVEVNGERQAGPNVLPVVYSRPETSPLKLKISSSTSDLEPLELTQK